MMDKEQQRNIWKREEQALVAQIKQCEELLFVTKRFLKVVKSRLKRLPEVK